jgi:hypothetical protein
MVVHACIPSTWEAEAEGWEAQAGLGYKTRPCVKTNKQTKKGNYGWQTQERG